jgi:hypothetical protein
MRKTAYRNPQGFKEVKCKVCGINHLFIDTISESGTCYRCVIKGIDPNSTITTDFSSDDENPKQK